MHKHFATFLYSLCGPCHACLVLPDGVLHVPLSECAQWLRWCPILCDPMDHGPPGSSLHGVLQARILEWVAMSPSMGSFQPRDCTRVSCIAGGFSATEPLGKPHKSLYSFFYVIILIFLSAALIWCIPFPCLCVNSFFSLVHSYVILCVLVHFFYLYALWFLSGTFLYLPFLCWNSRLVYALFWLQWACLCLLISLSGISITSVSLRSVPGVLPCSFETYSFASLFSLTLCVGFWALGETVTSPTLDWRGLWSRWELSFNLA